MAIQFSFSTTDAIEVKGYIWEAKNPKALMVIAHGMAETILRYQDFAQFLVNNGVTVYGYSHRGHFETAAKIDRLGYLGAKGWMGMAEDLGTVIEIARAANPNVPLVVFGHSMGSYITRTYLVDHPDQVSGLILSGTGYPAKLELKAASVLAGLEQKLKGADLPSKLMDKLSFGAFNKTFAPAKTPFDWLSSDQAQVQKYMADPWCGQLHPASFFEQMTGNLHRVLYSEKPKPARAVPMLVMSGAMDPVGQMGKGVKKAADFYQAAGYNVTLKLYENGRHEMLNEVNRQEVFDDILKWLNRL